MLFVVGGTLVYIGIIANSSLTDVYVINVSDFLANYKATRRGFV